MSEQVNKIYYYYLRDREKKPIVTICLMKKGGDISRGIALCSLSEPPVKKEGRKKARKRAYMAMFNRMEADEISTDVANDILYDVDNPDVPIDFQFKSEFNPELNDIEMKILKIKKGEDVYE